MNVTELYHLAHWFDGQYPALSQLYEAVIRPIQHNANNPNKMPLESELDELVEYLQGMSFSSLSIEQLEVLEEQSVRTFLGNEGAHLVESTVRISDYDPATAVQKLNDALAAINSTQKRLKAYQDALKNVTANLGLFEADEDVITIRVGFRRDASINNVSDLKNSAQDWYDIIRGLSLAAKEPPESTRIVGAGTGSIILFLAATAGVTFLLARVSKHVAGIAHDIIGVESAREELRQKKILSRAIEEDLNNQIDEKKNRSLEAIMEEVKAAIPDINGEAATALEKAVKKLLAFSRKGGDVDFVEPSADRSDGADDGARLSSSAHRARSVARVRKVQCPSHKQKA